MAYQERKQRSVATRVAWVGGSIIVLLAIAVSVLVLLPRRYSHPTPEPSQSAQLHTIAPTATAASTPMPVPTPTSTSYPSHTPDSTPTATKAPTSTVPAPSTATLLPSSTSSRTATLLPSSTSSRTATSHTPTPTVRAPSLTPRSPSPTPSPTAAYACPVLIEPQEGRSHTGAVTFRWQSAGTLLPGDVYDVRAWQGDEELGVGRTSEAELTVRDPSLVRGPGLYRWRVVVIRIVGSDPNKDWQIVSPLPDARTFSWGQRSQPTPTEEGG